MDRIDAMKVFVAAHSEGSLAGAGRKLGKSPAAVSRAIAFLEGHVGAHLLHRTTRSLKLSELGERYVAACKRILIDLEEAEIAAAGERSAPRGTLTVTAPVAAGRKPPSPRPGGRNVSQSPLSFLPHHFDGAPPLIAGRYGSQ